MVEQFGSAAGGGPETQPEAGDAIDRIWGAASTNSLIAGIAIAAAFVFGGVLFAVTAYAPTEVETATVLRQYNSSSGGGRSVCGVEVQIASGEKGRGGGGNVCSVYDEGDEIGALVSTVTGDVVGVRHAGLDLGRASNPLAGLVPIFALTALVSAIMAARRRVEPGLAKTVAATLGGGLAGLTIFWFLF